MDVFVLLALDNMRIPMIIFAIKNLKTLKISFTAPCNTSSSALGLSLSIHSVEVCQAISIPCRESLQCFCLHLFSALQICLQIQQQISEIFYPFHLMLLLQQLQ